MGMTIIIEVGLRIKMSIYLITNIYLISFLILSLQGKLNKVKL